MHEIRVHIAAPSTAHDDVRYRAQVAAIQDFQCASQFHVFHHSHLPTDPTHHSLLRETLRPALDQDRTPCNIDRDLNSLDSLISVIPDSQEAQLLSPYSREPDLKKPRTAAYTHIHTHTHASQSTHHPLLSDYVDSLSLPLEIHPPKPPVSSTPFQTHITATLSMLTERLKPARTYNASYQTRDLDPLERGYWFVRFNITDTDQHHRDRDSDSTLDGTSPVWPSPLFRTFWSFLSDFVGRDGRAGWGVWCILERNGVSPCEVTLKVYTWGEIAMHVYLLLFLASERHVRGMGAQWKDSREEVVVQMP